MAIQSPPLDILSGTHGPLSRIGADSKGSFQNFLFFFFVAGVGPTSRREIRRVISSILSFIGQPESVIKYYTIQGIIIIMDIKVVGGKY